MPVYYINSYNITDEEAYAKHGPPVIQLLHKYGAEVLGSGPTLWEGSAKRMIAIIKFPIRSGSVAMLS